MDHGRIVVAGKYRLLVTGRLYQLYTEFLARLSNDVGAHATPLKNTRRLKNNVCQQKESQDNRNPQHHARV
jgi:hypothetical protein